MNVIIAGSRTITDYEVVRRAVDEARANGLEVSAIIEGGACGVDALAARYAEEHGIEHIRVPADWGRYRQGAGKKRNELMAEMGDALIAIWNGASRGTKHMIECARKKGIAVQVVTLDR
ncbi:DUF2493 domain-containing protein [Geobacter benzoatilyticus]|uniref:DUF2493 domain-containing protein n=1 Tax=Geobacter benzoatilyticus TaxID=2815309 RepID=A0ABX7Q7E2_9BACT|nr:DUF2493 domain-containing protein [Geobacter benzoatilyticus]QSV46890.1 DUF2493 domain-containing protein [Geobacter benzoatilyticus]